MKAYTKMWYKMKANSFVTSGVRHSFNAISLVKQQSDELQKVVFPVLQRNAYFAHPENILIAMLADENANMLTIILQRSICLKSADILFTLKQLKGPTKL